ncbi:MAG: hypothetical protein M3157_01570 [Actinomycetota bacterium]|nr:hypothetical protein [Actinomycetota bacterium]
MEDRGEVCLEEEVARLRRAGMSPQEIADAMGVEPAWVTGLVEMLPEEEQSGPEESRA